MKNAFCLLLLVAMPLTSWATSFKTLNLSPVMTLNQKSPAEDISSLMGALDKVITENTKVSGVDQKAAPLTPPAQTIYNQLENDLDLCQTTRTQEPEVVSVEKDGVTMDFKKFDLRIFGENCPLDVAVSLTTTEQTMESMVAQFTIRMIFKTENYIQKYKVRSVEAGGVLKAKAVKNGNVVTLVADMQISGHSDSIEAGLVAQTIGFNVVIDADLSKLQFAFLVEQNAQMTYLGKTQKGYSRSKMVGFTQPDVVYKIDDKDVSESEYKTFTQSFIIPGMIEEEDDQKPDSKVPTNCSFVAYDKNAITAAELKSQMQKSALQTNGQLASGRTCSKNLQAPFKSADQEYSGLMQFGEEWISFGAASSKDPQALSSSVYVLYGDQAPQTKETEQLILGLQCQAVPTCQ